MSNGAFGNSDTRKNTLKAVQVAFYARKRVVRQVHRKRPTEANVIAFLSKRGYPARKLETLKNQL